MLTDARQDAVRVLLNGDPCPHPRGYTMRYVIEASPDGWVCQQSMLKSSWVWWIIRRHRWRQ